jgi:hypothetical protein
MENTYNKNSQIQTNPRLFLKNNQLYANIFPSNFIWNLLLLSDNVFKYFLNFCDIALCFSKSFYFKHFII